MVRELKKPSKGLGELEAMEKDTDRVVNEIERQREKDFKDELNTGFCFSVVFDTKGERDKWLQERGIKLVEDFFVKARDFNV
jgi:hypothetical protein